MKEAVPFSPYSREPGVVRTLAQLPESYLLYIGPVACARHDYLSGMYGFPDRISYLCLQELDVILGRTEVLVHEAVAEIRTRIAPKAKAVILYTGCQNSLSGVDFDALVRKLRETHGLLFTYCNMNHMLRLGSGNVYPLLFRGLLQMLDDAKPCGEEQQAQGHAVNLLCRSLKLHTGNDLPQLLARWELGELRGFGSAPSLEEVKQMAGARLNVVTHPDLLPAAKDMEERWGTAWMYLPASYRLEEIDKQYEELASFFGKEAEAGAARREAEEKTARVRELLEGAPVLLDGACFLKPLSAARFLLEEGFRISRVQHLPDLKQCGKTDPEGLAWLQEHDSRLLEFPPNASPAGQWELHCMTSHLSDAAKPLEGSWFGYSAVSHLMERLEQAWVKQTAALANRKEEQAG
jgi:hypothetical protein